MKVENKPILNKEESLFICLELQERLIPAMHDKETLVKNSNILMKMSEIYNIPVLITEQYPQRLGKTDSKIELPKNHKMFSKDYFSAFGVEDFVNEFNSLNKKNIIIFGLETHVCVYYTVFHLIQNGYAVYVVADACASRTSESKKIALKQMRKLGANVITTEMVLFAHIENSKVPNFKDLSNLVK
ncbi:isochorismatase family protein [Brachyspira sp.]|uniref:isochorismatase family protein n=1 Tax=Brachyspira sp. TaxID=1977261 RepID=UPI003D7C7531